MPYEYDEESLRSKVAYYGLIGFLIVYPAVLVGLLAWAAVQLWPLIRELLLKLG